MTALRHLTATALAAAALFATAAPAHAANTATITYYTIGETDKDANHLAGGTFDNEVQQALGPNGLPVLNTAAYGCTSNCYSPTGAPTDVLANGEITYWSPSLNNGGSGGTSDVVKTSSATVTLPFNESYSFFPPDGTGGSDYNGFQAATLTATLNNANTEQISFSIGADDMAFAFLDGRVVCDLGGVHGVSAGSCVTPFDITPGAHQLSVFFVDINNVQSGFYFDVQTQDVVTTPSVPEPSSLALIGAGLGLFGAISRRRARTGASA